MTIRETSDAIGSLVRTVFSGLFIAVVGYLGGWAFTYLSPDVRLKQKDLELQQVRVQLDATAQQVENQNVFIGELENKLTASNQRIVQLNTSLQLLKVDQRVAEIRVLNQATHPDTGEIHTQFTYQEITKEGQPVDHPRTFQIVGDLLYVDFWIVKFDDEFIENASLDRDTSICLFNRLFGEFQEPYEGYTLDQVGTRPGVYGRNGLMSDLERQIWSEFWTIADDRERAASMGIRGAHGQAVSARLRAGGTYRVTLRASDGLSIAPVEVAKRRSASPSA